MPSAISSLPFFGGELTSFDATDATVTENTTSGSYNSSLSRCSILTASPSGLALSPTWPAASTLWFHTTIWAQPTVYGANAAGIVLFYAGSTLVAQLLAQNGGYSNYTLTLQTLQAGVMTSVGTAQTFTYQTLDTLDVQLVAGASGSAALYSSGTLLASATGLNHTAWASGVTNIKLTANQGGTPGYGISIYYWSQVICDTTSTLGRLLITDSLTNESATNNGWSGAGAASNLADINEVPLNDATYIYAPSTGLTDTFYQSGLSLGTYNILARGVAARARVQGSGPANIKLAIRSGGANYVSSAVSLGTGFTAVMYAWTNNPATSSAWTPTTAAAVELGVQSLT